MNQQATAPVVTDETKMPAVKLGITKTAIGKLKKKYPADNVPDCTEKEGMADCKSVLRELTPLRTGVEARRKELVAGAVAWQKKVNSEANEYKEAIAEIEKPYREAKEAAEQKAAQEKKAREEAEERRIAEIEGKVADIQAKAEGLLGADLAALEARLNEVNEIRITDDEYMEFVEPASIMLGQVKQQLEMAVANARQYAEQEAKMREQREQFEAEERRLKERQAEIDRKEREQEEREREARAEQERKEREELERKAEAERAEREQKEQAEREAREKEHREKVAAELERRKPEDMKLREYADKLMDVAPPEISHPELVDVLEAAGQKLADLQAYIYTNTQNVES